MTNAPSLDDFSALQRRHPGRVRLSRRRRERLAAAIRAADGVLFVTPEYNWSMPGVLKNAIDWVSRMKDQPFKEKPVAIQSCSQGPLGGARMQYHWRMSMTFLGAYIFGTPEMFVGNRADQVRQGHAGAHRSADQGHRQAAARGLREVHRQDEALTRYVVRSLRTKSATAVPISSGLSSCRKCRPLTVISVWFGQRRQTSRWRPVRIEPGSALMKSFGTSDLASQAE